nr:L,D-transpeptidase family protein [Cytophagales bacterium]
MLKTTFTLLTSRSTSKWVIIFWFVLLHVRVAALQADENPRIAFEIRNLFEGHAGDATWRIGEKGLFHYRQALDFYSAREFQQAWIDQNNRLTCTAYEMRYEITQSKFDGLEPKDYHLAEINLLFEAMERASRTLRGPLMALEMAQLDILLTDGFLELASHIYMGKVDPSHGVYGWEIQRKQPKKEVVEKLASAIEMGAVRKAISSLYPPYPMYGRMRRSMRELYAKEAKMPWQWQQLGIETSVKPLEAHQVVGLVRKRLAFWEGNATDEDTEGSEFYDSALVLRIQEFQSRHGLNPDGVIGRATLKALNKSPKDLIRQASVNMERMRWLPDTLLAEVILVNIANYTMDFIRERDTVLHSNVIVGNAYRKTPIFNAPMSYLVFSPTWTVPPTILRKDILPAIKRDVNYLARKNMRLLTHSGTEVDPRSIDWSKVTADRFPYLVRQDPGPSNSLGKVKFMFPNSYNVYIHDTPSRELFARDDRALSSGCIRIQKPLELARLLLADQPMWSDDRIAAAMNSSKEQVVMLKRKVPVVMLYLTFWTDAKGIPLFREDIYERDEALHKALLKPIPLIPKV